MGVIYADKSYYNYGIDGSTSVSLRAALDLLLTTCGWTVVRTIADGVVYEGESPQARKVRLIIQDLGDVDQGVGFIRLTFWNQAETISGAVHPLIYRSGRVYSAVACECQLFVWLGTTTLGAHTDGYRGYDVAGGIPFIPELDLGDLCGGGDPLLVNDIFWSCSAGLGGGGVGGGPWGGGLFVFYDFYSFRSHFLCGNPYGVYGVSSGYENGIAKNYGDFGIRALQVRLIPHCPLRRSTGAQKTNNLRFETDAPLRVEPFIAWDGFIRGQLYNAFIECKRNVAGVEIVDDENGALTWVNYSYGPDWGNDVRTRYSSLFLLKGQDVTEPPAGGIGNLAY